MYQAEEGAGHAHALPAPVLLLLPLPASAVAPDDVGGGGVRNGPAGVVPMAVLAAAVAPVGVGVGHGPVAVGRHSRGTSKQAARC